MIYSIWIEETLTPTKMMISSSPLHLLCKTMRSIRSTKSWSALCRITTIILRLLRKISSAEQLQLMLMLLVKVTRDLNGTRMGVPKTKEIMQLEQERSQMMILRAQTKSEGILMPRQSVCQRKPIST